jgi:hypothetical protein
MFEAVAPPTLALEMSSNSAVLDLTGGLSREILGAAEADRLLQLGWRNSSPLADGRLHQSAQSLRKQNAMETYFDIEIVLPEGGDSRALGAGGDGCLWCHCELYC